MNVVILSTWSFEGVFGNFYICEYTSTATCRMTLIRRALDSPMSHGLQEFFPDRFGPFLRFVDSFEVGRLVKNRRKSMVILGPNFQ